MEGQGEPWAPGDGRLVDGHRRPARSQDAARCGEHYKAEHGMEFEPIISLPAKSLPTPVAAEHGIGLGGSGKAPDASRAAGQAPDEEAPADRAHPRPPLGSPAPLEADGRVGRSHRSLNGEGVERQKRAFRAACVDAELDASVIPHTLRHTAITWPMQAGVPIEEVSGFADVSMEELQLTYWHHSPECQEGVGSTSMDNRAHSAPLSGTDGLSV